MLLATKSLQTRMRVTKRFSGAQLKVIGTKWSKLVYCSKSIKKKNKKNDLRGAVKKFLFINGRAIKTEKG